MLATDTIVALSTPAGESALAMIRLSGSLCPEIEKAISGRKKPYFHGKQHCASI